MSKLWKWSYVAVLLLCLQTSTPATKIEIKCPEFCKCDIFQNLKRAVCQRKRLVTIELNIPPQAEILDLSDNQISELGDKIFLEIGLSELKLLNLSHNKVRQIHFNGFMGLGNLKTLDLSFNAIEYLTASWFESLISLEELYLRGNKLRTINEEAPINIKTLRILDISRCGITSLHANTFKLIPSLEILDISENYLQSIQVDILKILPKLTSLKARENNFNCKGKKLIEVGKYVKSKKILFADSCTSNFLTSITVNVNNKIEKFQKLQMEEDQETSTQTIELKNSWIYEITESNNSVKIVEVCNNGSKTHINGDAVYENSILMDIIKLSPWMTVSIIFVYGVLSGMVLICAFNLCLRKKEDKSLEDNEIPDGSTNSNIRAQSVPNLIGRRGRRNQRKSNSVFFTTIEKARRQMSREDSDDDDDFEETLVLNEFDVANSTPMAIRKPLYGGL